MDIYRVKLVGTLPLLHGRRDTREEDPPGGAANDAWYDEQWKFTHYADKSRNLVQPAHIIKAMLAGKGGGMRETAKAGSSKGKGKTERMSRACLRVDPTLVPFNGGIKVPSEDEIRVLDPLAAWSLDDDDEPEIFVLRRMVDRGVMISQVAIHGWELEFNLIDTSNGYFDSDWLYEGITYAIETVGMGTWRPEFGLGKLAEFGKVK